MKHRHVFPLFVLFVFCAQGLLARDFVETRPESVGVSTERLERLRSVMQEAVDQKETAGVVTLILRNGKLAQFEAFGKADIEANRPMQKDTIFRIASQTKAITSVAIMMLVEEGKISLTDPLSKFIPAFAKTTVAVAPAPNSPAGTPASIVPVNRPITIHDLLTHTSGIPYGFGGSVAQDKWTEAGFHGWYFGDRNQPLSEIVPKMAAIPMDAQPGEKFIYGYNADILGVVIEKVSGLTLADFFKKRIFEPLGLKDTFFYLPPAQKERLAAAYVVKGDGSIERAPEGRDGQGHFVVGPRVAFSGGSGLLSTATDYARFLQMLLNGGVLDGVRLLSPETVALMTVNHIGSLFGNTGFGLGFEVNIDAGKAGRYGNVGDFGWSGAYNTIYFVDPKEKLVGVFLTQILPYGSSPLRDKFRTLVYQAIVDPPKTR